MTNGTIFEKLAGPLTIGKLLRAYRMSNSLSSAEMEKNLKLPKGALNLIETGKKNLTLKETVSLVGKLDEPIDFYALIWMKEQARNAGLNLDHFFK